MEKSAGGLLVELLEWLKRLFKRKKATQVVASTAQSRYKRFSIEPTTTTEERYIRVPITHPADTANSSNIASQPQQENSGRKMPK